MWCWGAGIVHRSLAESPASHEVGRASLHRGSGPLASQATLSQQTSSWALDGCWLCWPLACTLCIQTVTCYVHKVQFRNRAVRHWGKTAWWKSVIWALPLCWSTTRWTQISPRGASAACVWPSGSASVVVGLAACNRKPREDRHTWVLRARASWSSKQQQCYLWTRGCRPSLEGQLLFTFFQHASLDM